VQGQTIVRRFTILPIGVWVALLLGCGAMETTARGEGAPGLQRALAKARRAAKARGASVALVQCGNVVSVRGSGKTRRGSGRRVRARTRFMAASSTKLVVAALVMSAVERGELRLDKTIDAFYPRLPRARRITVRMLLNHTSGLPDYGDDPKIAATIDDDPDHRWTRDELLAGIRKSDFEPGAKYKYSNTNFIVLGGILERVTGKPIEQLFNERIRAPLRVSRRTSFRYRPALSRQFAHPYIGREDQFVKGIGIPSDYWGEVFTDGGLAVTSADLARIADGVLRARLLKPGTVRTMTAGTGDDGGLGVFETRAAGSEWLGHDGSYGGYESELWYDPERHLTLAMLTSSDGSATKVWKALARSRAVRRRGDCA
jgi:D-alanyl-D-alanine carboxypeptidase